MAEESNFFKQTLQHHLNATRAGLCGQFEHAWNYNTGPDQNALLKLGPGETITFTGQLTDGTPLILTATNNLTGPSGQGFKCQTENPQSQTIVVGSDPATGQATLDFDVEVAAAGATVSYTTRTFQTSRKRWDAIDQNDNILLQKQGSEPTYDIVRADGGEWYITGDGGPVLGFRRGVGELDASGGLVWSAGWDSRDHYLVAYDQPNDFVVCAVAGDFIRGYEPSNAPFPQANGNETWEITLGEGVVDMKASGDGYVYVCTDRRTDSYPGATPTVFKNVFKIDVTDGSVVAAYDTHDQAFTFVGEQRLAVNSSGEVLLAAWRDTVPEDGGASANVFKFDSSLALLARYNVDWTPSGDSTPRWVSVTSDASDNVYVVEISGWGVKLDSALTTEAWNKRITGGVSFEAVIDLGHDQAGGLIVLGGGQYYGYDAVVERFDNNGDQVSLYRAPEPASDSNQMHVLPAPLVAFENQNLGTCFTSELSTNPPGKVQAIAAVKYVEGDIVSIFWNTANSNCEIDPTAWTAEHSVHGNIPVGTGGWVYNSPI